ncbi:MAG: formylglycine-generating enzyme family protein [Spirochaetes bacterium]|nr:formylglycine-generating enzyme family protein [Spirochaetota bacterium]
MVDANTLFNILSGNYEMGIVACTVEKLLPLLPPDIKPEYLYHSYPQHIVEVDQFAIAKRYVTVKEFAQFVADTGFVTQAQKDGWSWTWEDRWTKKNGLTWQRPFGIDALDALYMSHSDTMCVLQVSCNDARAYCEYLTAKTGNKVILPTEYMWEAFASVYGVPAMEQCVELSPNKIINLNDYCNVLVTATKKDEIPPGIVWEWTDSYFIGYPGCRPHKEYGTTYVVLRGGSYFSHPLQRTREYRFRRCPTARSPFYTFRICVVPQ